MADLSERRAICVDSEFINRVEQALNQAAVASHAAKPSQTNNDLLGKVLDGSRRYAERGAKLVVAKLGGTLNKDDLKNVSDEKLIEIATAIIAVYFEQPGV